MEQGQIAYTKDLKDSNGKSWVGYKAKRGHKFLTVYLGTVSDKTELTFEDLKRITIGDIGLISWDEIVEYFGEETTDDFADFLKIKFSESQDPQTGIGE